MVTMGVFPFQGKTHMVAPGIEPETSDHQATRLITHTHTHIYIYI